MSQIVLDCVTKVYGSDAEVSFTPDRYQVRFLQRGIPARSYWGVSFVDDGPNGVPTGSRSSSSTPDGRRRPGLTYVGNLHTAGQPRRVSTWNAVWRSRRFAHEAPERP